MPVCCPTTTANSCLCGCKGNACVCGPACKCGASLSVRKVPESGIVSASRVMVQNKCQVTNCTGTCACGCKAETCECEDNCRYCSNSCAVIGCKGNVRKVRCDCVTKGCNCGNTCACPECRSTSVNKGQIKQQFMQQVANE